MKCAAGRNTKLFEESSTQNESGEGLSERQHMLNANRWLWFRLLGLLSISSLF